MASAVVLRLLPRPALQLAVGRATFRGGEALALRVLARATVTCPRGEPDPLGRPRPGPPMVRTMRMRVIRESLWGWVASVGAESSHAAFVHQGTVPHGIDPVRAPRLVFYSHRWGKVVYARHVNHPGTRPNPWLWRSTVEIVRSVA